MKNEFETVDIQPLVTDLPIHVRNRLVSKIYTLLSLQLITTACTMCLFTLSDPVRIWVISNPLIYYFTMFCSVFFDSIQLL